MCVCVCVCVCERERERERESKREVTDIVFQIFEVFQEVSIVTSWDWVKKRARH